MYNQQPPVKIAAKNLMIGQRESLPIGKKQSAPMMTAKPHGQQTPRKAKMMRAPGSGRR